LKRISVKFNICCCLIIIANFTGCGVKGNPVVLSKEPDDAMIIRNFKAASSNSAVELQWYCQGKDSKNNYIAVERSEVGSPGNECKSCSRTYERIGQVLLKEVKQENKKYISFTDKKVTQGKTYNYRLLLCNEFNNCFENATTEINFK
jgi:hypothetical protein